MKILGRLLTLLLFSSISVIVGAVYITSHQKNRTQNLHENVDIVVEGYPLNVTVRWFFGNEQPIFIHTNFKRKMAIRTRNYGNGGFQSTLTIRSVSRLESGWYKCVVSNGLQSAEYRAYVNVVYKPIADNNPKIAYWGTTDTGKAPCFMRANPPVYRYQWIFDGVPINFTDHPRYSQGINGTLFVKSVTRADGGIYTCKASNSMGHGLVKIQVKVGDLPKFTITPLPYYQRTVGKTVVLPCQAFGNPPPKVFWRKDENDLVHKIRYIFRDGNLTIVNVEKRDHGLYECIAENRFKRIIRRTKLLVEGTTPHAPSNVTVLPGVFKARLTWLPAHDGGYKQNYVVWYRLSDFYEDWKTLRVEPSNSHSFTIYGLEPDSLYEFRVQARNEIGDSLQSDSVLARTAGYSPGAASSLPHYENGTTYVPNVVKNHGPRPSSVEAVTVHVHSGSIVIEWEYDTDGRPPVFYFVVQRSLNNITWIQVGERIHEPGRSMTWPNPVQGNVYNFRVIAYSVMSHSLPSAVVSIQFNSDKLDIGMIAGICGALGFVILACILGVTAYCCVTKRKQSRHGKYSSASQFDGQNGLSSKWNLYDETDGTKSLTTINHHPSKSSIYTIPHLCQSTDRHSLGHQNGGPKYDDWLSNYHEQISYINGDASRYPICHSSASYHRSYTVPYLRSNDGDVMRKCKSLTQSLMQCPQPTRDLHIPYRNLPSKSPMTDSKTCQYYFNEYDRKSRQPDSNPHAVRYNNGLSRDLDVPNKPPRNFQNFSNLISHDNPGYYRIDNFVSPIGSRLQPGVRVDQESNRNNCSNKHHGIICSKYDAYDRHSTKGGRGPTRSLCWSPYDESISSGIGSRFNGTISEVLPYLKPSSFSDETFDCSSRKPVSTLGDEYYEFDFQPQPIIFKEPYRGSKFMTRWSSDIRDERSLRLMYEYQEFRKRQRERLSLGNLTTMDSEML